MAAGQVSFKDNKKVKKILVAQRENPIVNRLNKTKEEKYPDLMQEKDDHLRQLRKKDQAAQQARVKHHPFLPPTRTIDNADEARLQKKEEARVSKERQEKKWQKDHAYDEIFTEENMAATSNQERDENWEDDFM
jgi:hypothetical protein